MKNGSVHKYCVIEKSSVIQHFRASRASTQARELIPSQRDTQELHDGPSENISDILEP